MKPRKARPLRRKFQFLILSTMLMSASAVNAATVSISADVWGSVRDSDRDGSFDSISSTDAIFANNIASSSGYIDRGVWEFDLSELPSGNITSVDLEVSLIVSSGGFPEHDIYQYVGDGAINIEDADSGTFLSSSSGGINGLMDVTAFVTDAGTLAAGFAGFNVRLAGEGGSFTIQKQWQDPWDVLFGNGTPRLIVEYTEGSIPEVPLPATVWLFATALLGVLGISKGRKKDRK